MGVTVHEVVRVAIVLKFVGGVKDIGVIMGVVLTGV